MGKTLHLNPNQRELEYNVRQGRFQGQEHFQRERGPFCHKGLNLSRRHNNFKHCYENRAAKYTKGSETELLEDKDKAAITAEDFSTHISEQEVKTSVRLWNSEQHYQLTAPRGSKAGTLNSPVPLGSVGKAIGRK